MFAATTNWTPMINGLDSYLSLTFGIFSHYLSIDEYSCKIFMRISIRSKEGRCEPARVVNSLCNVRKRTKPRGLFWQSVYINSSTGTYKTKVNQRNWNSSVKQVARLSHYKMWNYQKKRKGFLEEPNCGDISIGRWNGNQVFTRASNYSTSSTTSTCRRYSQVQWSQINDPQPHMVQKYNQYMGCIDQLDAFLNNMRPAVGWKKW